MVGLISALGDTPPLLSCFLVLYIRYLSRIKVLFIIATDEGETIYSAMRMANTGLEKGDEVSMFMLGKGVLFEKSGSD